MVWDSVHRHLDVQAVDQTPRPCGGSYRRTFTIVTAWLGPLVWVHRMMFSGSFMVWHVRAPCCQLQLVPCQVQWNVIGMFVVVLSVPFCTRSFAREGKPHTMLMVDSPTSRRSQTCLKMTWKDSCRGNCEVASIFQ